MIWQPIETLPKNGRQYLVIRRLAEAPYHSMSVASWVMPEGKWLTNLIWFDDDEFKRIWTHWCELPTPPKPD